MKLQWIVGVCAVGMMGSVLLARQGMVITQDGQRYSGDVVEQGNAFNIVQPNRKGGMQTVTINKGNVKDIVYADKVAQQVKADEAKLDRRDVNGRLALARFAMDNGALDSARDVLEDARKIEPDNQQVKSLLDTVNAQVQMSRGGKAPAPPTSQPTPTDQPATQESTAGASTMPTRMVTAEEINRIRQKEWDRRQELRMTIDGDTRRRFLAGSDVTVAQFQRLSIQEQAAQILDKGNANLADGVHILGDPATVNDFKVRIQGIVRQGCAANACHGGPNPKGGTFYQFTTGNALQQTYTDFLILQTYTKSVNKVQKSLVDHQFPEQSLLLQFMLPENVAETPHPNIPNFKALVRAKNNQQYQFTLAWIKELPSVALEYGIDLTREPEKKTPAKGR